MFINLIIICLWEIRSIVNQTDIHRLFVVTIMEMVYDIRDCWYYVCFLFFTFI